jgi:hypothetical protein
MITADTPITVPAVAEKTFPHLWIYNLIIHAPTTTTGKVEAEFLPYNAETGEIGPASAMTTISSDKLWDAVNAVPEMKVAFDAIVAAVPAMKVWIASQTNSGNNPTE